MAQHFLLSALVRDLSPLEVARLSDEEAWQMLYESRFGSSGTQRCPACGVVRKHYFIKSRKQWRCADKDCGHTFSVTSGTTFAYHKLPLPDLLYAVAKFITAVEGESALRMSYDMGIAHKSAFVLNHKIRKAIYKTLDLTPLKGEVEMDGCYFHYYVRPKNKHKNRVDRRLRSNMNPNKRATFVMRQRGEPGQGAVRTIVEVIKAENERDVTALVKKYVERGTTIFADEHPCYAALAARYHVKQVNHAEEYSADDGTNQNQAESFFNRERRLFSRIHKCAPKYLKFYANEIAWREDNRRKTFKWLFEDLLKKCLSVGQSKYWSKYWTGNHLAEDTLFIAG